MEITISMEIFPTCCMKYVEIFMVAFVSNPKYQQMGAIHSLSENQMTKRKSWKRLGFSCLPNKGKIQLI